jgi:hypothetical protein
MERSTKEKEIVKQNKKHASKPPELIFAESLEEHEHLEKP